MYDSVMIKLPGERGAQLKAFAANKGLSVTEAIGALLRKVGAAADVPGFSVEHLPGSFCRLRIDTFDITLPDSKVRELADAIVRLIDARAVGAYTLSDARQGKDIILGRGRGTSFVIAAVNTRTNERVSRPMSVDLARDVADQLHRAVAVA